MQLRQQFKRLRPGLHLAFAVRNKDCTVSRRGQLIDPRRASGTIEARRSENTVLHIPPPQRLVGSSLSSFCSALQFHRAAAKWQNCFAIRPPSLAC
jgi:hypothetical protein